jgi:hypothetical protein
MSIFDWFPQLSMDSGFTYVCTRIDDTSRRGDFMTPSISFTTANLQTTFSALNASRLCRSANSSIPWLPVLTIGEHTSCAVLTLRLALTCMAIDASSTHFSCRRNSFCPSLHNPRNQLIGDVLEIRPNKGRLRTYTEHVIPRSFDQGGTPPRGNRAQRVPSVSRH